MQNKQKKSIKIIIIVLVCFISTILSARYKESYKACIKRYGKPIAESNISSTVKMCTFKKSDYLIEIYFMKTRKYATKPGTFWRAEGIIYSRVDKENLSPKEIDTFLSAIVVKGKHGYRTWIKSWKEDNVWYLSNTSRSKKVSKWDKPLFATLEEGKLYFFSDRLSKVVERKQQKKLEGF